MNPTSDTCNQVKARELCTSYGDDWDLPDSLSFKEHLERFLNVTNLNNVWTAIEKQKHPTWLWVNGSNCKFKIFSLKNRHKWSYTYYSCVFAKRNYRVLVRFCVCVSVFVCVCVFAR